MVCVRTDLNNCPLLPPPGFDAWYANGGSTYYAPSFAVKNIVSPQTNPALKQSGPRIRAEEAFFFRSALIASSVDGRMGCQTASSSTTTATTPPHSSGIIPWTGSERSRRVLSAQTAALSSPTSVHAKPTPSHQMLESLSYRPETHSRMFLNRPQSVPRPFPTRAVVQGDLGGRLAGARPTTALIQPQQGDAGRAPPGGRHF